MKKMNKLSLRQAKPDDTDVLQNLFTETISSVCRRDYNENQINAWKSSVKNRNRWKEAICSQYFLVAEMAGMPLGFASLKNGNHVDFLYVHKNHQRQGIADKLYQEIEKRALKGTRTITSDVSKTARSFFEKRGFRVQHENRNVINGVEIINFRMQKVLKNAAPD